jgi:hypothetical protein
LQRTGSCGSVPDILEHFQFLDKPDEFGQVLFLFQISTYAQIIGFLDLFRILDAAESDNGDVAAIRLRAHPFQKSESQAAAHGQTQDDKRRQGINLAVSIDADATEVATGLLAMAGNLNRIGNS